MSITPEAAEALRRLPTPSLVLDAPIMQRNIDNMACRARSLGVKLRPHLKTTKSVAIARRLLGEDGAATVSTLAEAEALAGAGVTDIVYAVGISPDKLERVVRLRKGGCDLAVLLDSLEQAEAVAAASTAAGMAIPALIEIDCDGHRGGLRPDDRRIVDIGHLLVTGGAELRGVLTHAGESYNLVGTEAHAAAAENERAAAAEAAGMLLGEHLPCPVISVGSTPTAMAARDLTGVTELRAGVYVFCDLVQAGIGACSVDDIALSVLTTVVGHQTSKGWIIVDAGWMALSGDRGTRDQPVDQGYGVVCDLAGRPIADLIVLQANQEHGIVGLRPGVDGRLPNLPVGTRLRILPNHACATAAQFTRYEVFGATPGGPLEQWPRFGGW